MPFSIYFNIKKYRCNKRWWIHKKRLNNYGISNNN